MQAKLNFVNVFSSLKHMMFKEFLPLLDIQELVKVASLNKEMNETIDPMKNCESQEEYSCIHFVLWMENQCFDKELINYFKFQKTSITVNDLIEAQVKQSFFKEMRIVPSKKNYSSIWNDENFGGSLLDGTCPANRVEN